MKESDFLSRNKLLLGDDAVQRLARARVVVVGLGAVGSFAVEALVRAGVGWLRLVDFDEVRPSNLNRQLFAVRANIGKKKTEAAAERISAIQPSCVVQTLSLFADPNTFGAILADSPDVLIDAIDSVGPKAALLEAAVRAGIPSVISSMGAANRLDPMGARVAALPRTRNCPLARQIRRRIDDPAIAKRITCIYSEELPQAEPAPAESSDESALQRGRPRRVLGSLVCVTGVFGLVAAREAIRAICRK
jgi:tRNA A37 threonylcarbamoyladenosine dehydratase